MIFAWIFGILIGYVGCMALDCYISGVLMKRRRFEAAKAALTGLLADPNNYPELRKGHETCTQATVRLAVEHGDELIERLER